MTTCGPTGGPEVETVARVLAVGLCTLDLVYAAAAAPGPDEKVQATAQEVAAGGPATGAAVTAAALGSAVTLVTALGTHPLAAVAAAELRGRGVSLLDATPAATAAPAVSSAVVAADGRRSVVSVNAGGLVADPPAGLAGLAARAGAVLVDGHHPRLALAAARASRLTVLDGGSWKPVLPQLLPLVQVAVFSAAFRLPGAGAGAGGGAGARDGDAGDAWASALAAQAAYGVPFVAVTAGPEPVRWAAAGRSGTVPVPAIAAVDTLGAGDAFHGALLHVLAGRATPVPVPVAVDALAYAAEVAAVRCATFGPRSWLEDPALGRRRPGED
jgi:sugar/nucleoside kinase (ribokinase family)